MNLRKINVNVNVDECKFMTETKATMSKSAVPTVFLDEKVLLCVQFKDRFGEPSPFNHDDVFELSIDNDFTHTNSLMAYTPNSLINLDGDWTESNPLLGKICFRIYCNTNQFHAKIGKLQQIFATIEIQKFSNGYKGVILQDNIKCNNTIKTIEGIPLSSDPEYFNITQTDSRYVQINNLNMSQATPTNIDSGTLTKINTHHILTVTNDIELNTITTTVAGSILLINTEELSFKITLTQTGNIVLPSNSNYQLLPNTIYMLNFQNNKWYLLCGTTYINATNSTTIALTYDTITNTLNSNIISNSLENIHIKSTAAIDWNKLNVSNAKFSDFDNPGFIPLTTESISTTEDGTGKIFLEDNKLKIIFNNGGTTRIKSINLDDETTTWNTITI